MIRSLLLMKAASSSIPVIGRGTTTYTSFGNPRRLMEYWAHREWNARIVALSKAPGEKQEPYIFRLLRKVPWAGIGTVAFMFIFFGFDLGVGMNQTSASMKRDVENGRSVPELDKSKWTKEQISTYSNGTGPRQY